MEKDDFIELKKLWYQKLKNSGFEDLEMGNGDLKDWPSQRLQRDYTIEQFKEKRDYYHYASELYWENNFDSPLHKKIWFMHSEGFTYEEIAKGLRSKKNKINKDNVQIIIHKYAKAVHRKILDAEE